MESLLIIDDNEEIRSQLKWGLTKEYSISLAESRAQALALYRRTRQKVVILDLGLPPHEDTSIEGLACLEELLAENPYVKVIIMTGNAEKENALQAIGLGAYDFYPKPPVLAELKVILSRAFHLANIEEQNRALREQTFNPAPGLNGMVGVSPQMQVIFATIRKVATTDVPTLITGESGTGKELVARAIHELSSRSSGPFIPINCGAIPENLMESELFGHEKGAFTGAHVTVTGKIQSADKGTLFLDELGELPTALQVKLLRYLQDGLIQRVGGREYIPVDAHILCATNVDPAKAIAEGKLREDLFYRVGVVSLHLPPLRDRGDDRILLSTHFLNLFSEQYHKKARKFSKAAIQMIESFPWPGNVRELQNRIQRAVIMSEGPILEPHDLNFPLSPEQAPQGAPDGPLSLKEAKERLERDLILGAIERSSGNIVKAADELGVSRPTLYDMMRKYSLHSKISDG